MLACKRSNGSTVFNVTTAGIGVTTTLCQGRSFPSESSSKALTNSTKSSVTDLAFPSLKVPSTSKRNSCSRGPPKKRQLLHLVHQSKRSASSLAPAPKSTDLDRATSAAVDEIESTASTTSKRKSLLGAPPKTKRRRLCQISESKRSDSPPLGPTPKTKRTTSKSLKVDDDDHMWTSNDILGMEQAMDMSPVCTTTPEGMNPWAHFVGTRRCPKLRD